MIRKISGVSNLVGVSQKNMKTQPSGLLFGKFTIEKNQSTTTLTAPPLLGSFSDQTILSGTTLDMSVTQVGVKNRENQHETRKIGRC